MFITAVCVLFLIKLNPYMAPGPGVEPEPHWWEASALTTVPSLLPYIRLQSPQILLPPA